MNETFDEKLMREARALATDAEPERDLWPSIESAIAAPKRGGFGSIAAQAAAVLLLIAGSSGLTYLVIKNDVRGPMQAGDGHGFYFERASFGAEYALGPDYQAARNTLRAGLDEQLERLSPEARAEVEKNLQAIRTAIDEINRALADEPDSRLLQELLFSAYRDELTLMRQVDNVANAVMVRTDI